MEINSQVNTFLEGMNLDSDITMLSDKQYRWAQNVRLLTDNAGTTGILQNIEDIRQYLGGLEISENILGTAVSRWYNTDKESAVWQTVSTFPGSHNKNDRSGLRR